MAGEANGEGLKGVCSDLAGCSLKDTIFALASGSGRSGVAVMRVSGPRAGEALEALTARDRPPPRRVSVRRLVHPVTEEVLDVGMVIWFPAPASYTGEDVAEFHVHGGSAVIESVADALGAVSGLRPAEPGEFTRRAFENERLDLTAAEGIADLVAAETAAQRRQALRQVEGALGGLYEDWRARLLRALAHAEAAIDFAEEELPADLAADVADAAAAVGAEIRAHLADGHRGERLRDGVQVAILGAPNVGKSSLLNYLARREAAIVAPTAGTTRDVVEVRLDLGGYPVTVADTAGLRASGDAVEREGVRRAEMRARAADLKLVVFDARTWPELEPRGRAFLDRDSVVLLNKADLGGPRAVEAVDGVPALLVSARTGCGGDRMLAAVERLVGARLSGDPGPALTRARHRHALEECAAALGRAGEIGEAELAAEDLRIAVRALGRITGRVDIEDVLDMIFRDFCIGK